MSDPALMAIAMAHGMTKGYLDQALVELEKYRRPFCLCAVCQVPAIEHEQHPASDCAHAFEASSEFADPDEWLPGGGCEEGGPLGL